MKPRIAIQLYTLREEMKEDVFGTLEKVAALGYEGVEFAGFFDIPAEQMKAKLDELGLKAVASHTAIEALENDLDDVIAYSKIIANKNLVCPWSDVADEKTLEEILDKLKSVLPKIEDEDMVLLYHNHDHEFKLLNDKPLLNHMIERLEGKMKMELDTFWVYRAGFNPVEYMEQHKDVISLIHIKDGTSDQLKALGEGTAPIKAVREQAISMNLEWVVVENDEPTPTGLEDCKRSIDYLKKLEK